MPKRLICAAAASRVTTDMLKGFPACKSGRERYLAIFEVYGGKL